MNNYQMFRKIQEQAKQYEEYDNFDREDLIDELLEEKRINENNLQEIDRLNNIISELEKYIVDKELECNGKIINYSIPVEERIKYGNYNEIYDDILDKLKELKDNS